MTAWTRADGELSASANTKWVEALVAPESASHLRLGHCVLIAICAVAFGFDLAEVALGNVLSAVFSSPPHLAAAADLAWLVAAPFVGAIAGAPAFGWLADRWGRRPALCAILAGLAAASSFGFLVTDIRPLIGVRLACGLFLGAYPPVMFAYLTEVLPAKVRAPSILTVAAIGALGAPLGVFLIRGLATAPPFGVEAWRWAMALFGIAAGMLAAALATARAPPVRKSSREVDRPSAAVTAAHAPNRIAETNFAALSFLSPWATSAFPVLTGAVLVHKGIDPAHTLLYVAIASFGPVVGPLIVASFVDRLPRKIVLQACMLLMLGGGLGFVLDVAPALLVCLAFLFTLATSVYLSASNIYLAELYPLRSRARALANLWACNRVGAAIAPLALVPLLSSYGPFAMFTVVATALVASFVILAFCPPGRGGQVLR
jgi:putative MFS transporter